MASFNSVAVIGGGAYGTALACAARRAGRDVVLYARNTEAAAQMQTTRKNPKLPGAILERLNQELVRAIAAPDVRARLASLGADARSSTPAEMRSHVASEIAKWKRVVEVAKIERQ